MTNFKAVPFVFACTQTCFEMTEGQIFLTAYFNYSPMPRTLQDRNAV